MTLIVETLVSVFCLVAAGMLMADAVATLPSTFWHHGKRREVPERCEGERTCD